jgi:glycerol-3-phosphate dehydrogenase (NAD(P)+)
MRVTVIGAGYMGSAMAVVARKRGHDVRLWGTWLDDALLAPCERGEPHPRLGLTLEGIALMRASRLPEALDGAELVVHAVNSD